MAWVAALSLLASACASGGGPSGATDPSQVTFAPELGVVLDQMTRTPDGVYYHDFEVGAGAQAEAGDRIEIEFTGWLPDGTIFDSSLAVEDPVVFNLNRREVIRGWVLGIPGMKVGGRRLLVLPSSLAYGSQGFEDVVPGNATLVFAVRLVDVK
jgi:peptidylprolyl isomerase